MKAIKKKNITQDQKKIEYIWNERKILEDIDNPFIVKMRYAFQTTTKLFYILEYCPGGELYFYIQRN
jgi:serine/threonine protein kinase